MSDVLLKQKIARQFSRAASRYDAAADMQKQISADAVGYLHPNYQTLLDIGCGTGYWHSTLSQKTQQLYACDLAEGMLHYASVQNSINNVCYLAADAERLPIASDSLDGVFSSMALQWCHNIDTVFADIYRVLKPKGHAVLAILSQGAMHELNQAWLEVDSNAHTNTFESHNCLIEAGTSAGFLLSAEQKDYVSWHADIRSLLGSIKQIGANVLTHAGTRQPLTRVTLTELESAYTKAFLQNNQLPLTYSVSFLSLIKPN